MEKGENTDEETKNDRTAGLAAGTGLNRGSALRHTGHDAARRRYGNDAVW